jgi:WD40 repeat protein
VVEIKNHFSRVTDIWYDDKINKMYSLSNDRRFITCDLKMNNVIEINRSVHNYTKLYPDIKNNRIFLATEGGIVELYSLKNYPPQKICKIRISDLGQITDLFYNMDNSYLYTCDKKGKVSILEIGQRGKEKISSEIIQFGYKISINAITYNSSRNEIITGDNMGNVIIWNIKNGEPIFSWVAHENMAIYRIFYNEKKNILITGSKDKSIKFWKMPEFWYEPQIEKYENEELAKINNELRAKKIKMQQIMQGYNIAEYESDNSENDDNLNGWNFNCDEDIDDNINAPPQ